MHDNWRELLGTLTLLAIALAVVWLLNQFGVKTDFETVFRYLMGALLVLLSLYLGAHARALARFCQECGARRQAESELFCVKCGSRLMDQPGWTGYVITPIILVAAFLAVLWVLGQLRLETDARSVFVYFSLALIVLPAVYFLGAPSKQPASWVRRRALQDPPRNPARRRSARLDDDHFRAGRGQTRTAAGAHTRARRDTGVENDRAARHTGSWFRHRRAGRQF
jgi:hypothetical protein